jgi:hypothetical protein
VFACNGAGKYPSLYCLGVSHQLEVVAELTAYRMMRISLLLAALGAHALLAQGSGARVVGVTPSQPGVARLQEEVSVGRFDGPDQYLFGRVTDIAVTRGGHLLVADDVFGAVREFDNTGVFIRSYGRKGRGPGEYVTPSELGLLSDGRVLVRDAPGSRVNVYSQDGRSVATWPINGGVSAFVPSMVVTPGDVVWIQLTGSGGPRSELESGAAITRRYLRLRNGAVIDTIFVPIPARPSAVVSYAQSSTTVIPFVQPVVRNVVSPLGIVVHALADRYDITLSSPARISTPGQATARQAVIFRKTHNPIPVLPAEAAEIRAGITAHARSRQPGWIWNGPAIPQRKPVFKDLSVDGDGRIWVHLHTTARRDTSIHDEAGRPWQNPWVEQPTFDVLSPDGVLVGRVVLPSGARLLGAKANLLWILVRGRDDVQFVKRLRISWPATSP